MRKGDWVNGFCPNQNSCYLSFQLQLIQTTQIHRHFSGEWDIMSLMPLFFIFITRHPFPSLSPLEPCLELSHGMRWHTRRPANKEDSLYEISPQSLTAVYKTFWTHKTVLLFVLLSVLKWYFWCLCDQRTLKKLHSKHGPTFFIHHIPHHTNFTPLWSLRNVNGYLFVKVLSSSEQGWHNWINVQPASHLLWVRRDNKSKFQISGNLGNSLSCFMHLRHNKWRKETSILHWRRTWLHSNPSNGSSDTGKTYFWWPNSNMVFRVLPIGVMRERNVLCSRTLNFPSCVTGNSRSIHIYE